MSISTPHCGQLPSSTCNTGCVFKCICGKYSVMPQPFTVFLGRKYGYASEPELQHILKIRRVVLQGGCVLTGAETAMWLLSFLAQSLSHCWQVLATYSRHYRAVNHQMGIFQGTNGTLTPTKSYLWHTYYNPGTVCVVFALYLQNKSIFLKEMGLKVGNKGKAVDVLTSGDSSLEWALPLQKEWSVPLGLLCEAVPWWPG